MEGRCASLRDTVSPVGEVDDERFSALSEPSNLLLFALPITLPQRRFLRSSGLCREQHIVGFGPGNRCETIHTSSIIAIGLSWWGTKGSTELPKGLLYEDGKGGGSWRKCSGPSAAQTPLWQFIDIALSFPTGKVHSINNLSTKDSDALERDDGFLKVRLILWKPDLRFRLADKSYSR